MSSGNLLGPAPVDIIFFDAGGTLLYPEPGVGEVYALYGRRHGVEVSPDALEASFREAFAQKLAEGVLTQIASLLNVECGGILVLREGAPRERFSILPENVESLDITQPQAGPTGRAIDVAVRGPDLAVLSFDR